MASLGGLSQISYIVLTVLHAVPPCKGVSRQNDYHCELLFSRVQQNLGLKYAPHNMAARFGLGCQTE